ncbi:hypothetical protein [Streptomyces sp. SS]|uniref:hypothetical protein n=1 Tax=Streptomyces sp. SS TaxID=260742 RepID=UPI000474A490|nr:hypothetical protein [Streptomyces sp. SS]
MRVPLLLGATTAVIVLSACGAPQARQDGASTAGRTFEAALAAGDLFVAFVVTVVGGLGYFTAIGLMHR